MEAPIGSDTARRRLSIVKEQGKMSRVPGSQSPMSIHHLFRHTHWAACLYNNFVNAI